MARRVCVTASAEQLVALKELARSERRDEADRARALLLSLKGWTSAAIGIAFGVTADSVRHWRVWYASGGIEGLRAAVVPGPSGGAGFGRCRSQPRSCRSRWRTARTGRSRACGPRSSAEAARQSRDPG